MKRKSGHILLKNTVFFHFCRKKSGGFILYELMGTVIVLCLSGIIITSGISTSANSYKEITEEISSEMILNEYESAIRSLIEASESINYFEEIGAAVIESNIYEVFGYIDDEDGYLRFRAVAFDGDEITKTDRYFSLIPNRQNINSTSVIKTGFNAEIMDNKSLQIKIENTGKDGRILSSDTFFVWPDFVLMG